MAVAFQHQRPIVCWKTLPSLKYKAPAKKCYRAFDSIHYVVRHLVGLQGFTITPEDTALEYASCRQLRTAGYNINTDSTICTSNNNGE